MTKEKVISFLNKQKGIKFLKNLEVIEWLYKNPYKNHPCKQRQIKENTWGKNTSKYIGNRWTTNFSESIFNEFLKIRKEKSQRITYRINNKKITPDFTTDKAVYEIKCRTWNTQGTAGEKILGVPYKYCDIPIISKKPLFIVLMAFQELDNFGIFDCVSENKRKFLKFYADMNIHFVRFTDLLEQLYLTEDHE
jgi:hypothetical protein